MSSAQTRTIAIVGVGPSMSRSLALWLASLGWNIVLIARSERNLSAIAEEARAVQKNKESKIIWRAADASDSTALKAALDWSVEQFQCKLDVLNYNVARLIETNILDVTPEELELDFRTSAVGTLVAGQWFAKNARLDFVSQGEKPLFLVTGGVLDKAPMLDFSSLCTAKAASQTVSRLFAQSLPEKHGILVGMPLVSEEITDRSTGDWAEGFHPDDIIQKLFKPFFEDRVNGTGDWTVERVF
jgi:NAD(P)-dependent dehydrogenase (short-subunit alcohol dehydrogenase family)